MIKNNLKDNSIFYKNNYNEVFQMKITLLGSLGNINRLVIPRLIADGHEVTVVTSRQERATAITALGATPAVGTMTDLAFLTTQFTGRDVVYLMISGTSPDLFASAQQQAAIFQAAIRASHVQKVVNLSSIGAQDARSGSLYAYHFIEDALTNLSDVDVAFVRPTGFYNNLYANLASVHSDHAIYANIPATVQRKYVDPADIADVVYALVSQTPTGKTIRYVVSDTFTGTEMIAAFSTALGFDVRLVEISDQQYADALRQNGIPESIIGPFVKSSQLQRQPSEMYADLTQHPVHDGHVKLADFAQKFARAFNDGDHAPQAHTIATK